MMGPSFRIHPAIGFARVGNSEQHYLAPETMAALPVPGGDDVSGGLPIKPGTESTHITSSDLRDGDGRLVRQGARFRIFRYPASDGESYPNGGGTEVRVGDTVDGRRLLDIVWTVHVANKKANAYVLEWPSSGLLSVIANYEKGTPPLRNPSAGDPSSPDRIRRLTIDPGPRAIRGTADGAVAFDDVTTPSFWDDSSGDVVELPAYPTSFPGDSFAALYSPSGDITTLGHLETDEHGRLIVVAAYGRACAWFRADGAPYPLDADVDNDGWFDDTADGPVSAVLVFGDGSTELVQGAWVVATDPSYAPQTANIVTLWDDIFDTWVRKLALLPEVFDDGFSQDFSPFFDRDIQPLFRAVGMQRWNTFLPRKAIEAHDAVAAIRDTDDPGATLLAGLGFIRDPNDPAAGSVGVPLMPLSLGDAGQPYLSPTLTQYFFLTQWNAGRFERGQGPQLGHGEYLDKASLFNCLGGRFSPGIDMTFVVRDPLLWENDWQTSGAGPFRIRARPLDYRRFVDASTGAATPALTWGYVPVHASGDGLEPGDTSKFMAVPWHTDYNSCATHATSPNPAYSATLYWSWPAQRPVSVYVADDVDGGRLPAQRYSIRGPGTSSPNPANQGRYDDRLDIVDRWSRIGMVLQGSAIDHGEFAHDQYLEVESGLDQGGSEPGVDPWPLRGR